jgi:hypothetical protein
MGPPPARPRPASADRAGRGSLESKGKAREVNNGAASVPASAIPSTNGGLSKYGLGERPVMDPTRAEDLCGIDEGESRSARLIRGNVLRPRSPPLALADRVAQGDASRPRGDLRAGFRPARVVVTAQRRTDPGLADIVSPHLPTVDSSRLTGPKQRDDLRAHCQCGKGQVGAADRFGRRVQKSIGETEAAEHEWDGYPEDRQSGDAVAAHHMATTHMHVICIGPVRRSASE